MSFYEKIKEIFDQMYDVVFKDGKEFKVYRRVFLEGSFLFKKVLNSEMKEFIEEIFCLEMICEFVMEKVLEYVCL